MRKFVFVFISFLDLATRAQQPTGDGLIMRILAQAPDSAFRSTNSFSGFLKTNFKSDNDILKAVYFWVAKSVSYDVENMYKISFEENPAELIEMTFRTRKAICQGYAELFNDLCRRTGVKSYVVHGFTKQEGEVGNSGHAWIVATVNNEWYGIDPTWGAGYVHEGKFVRCFALDYFMVPPEIFILSHMPFDPMWQCMDYPFSLQDFYFGKSASKEKGDIFNYADSIYQFVQLPAITQNQVILRRIEKNRIRNTVFRDYADFLAQSIENERLANVYQDHLKIVDNLNEATDHYNNAANLFNRYISYFNRQFKPGMADAGIRKMIDTCDSHLKIARRLIVRVDPFNKQISQNTDQLKSLIRKLQNDVNEQKDFVGSYLNTPKEYRSRLFRKSAY